MSSPLSAPAGQGDTGFEGSRPMCTTPHTDGLIMLGAELLAKDSANLVLTRNGVGDWSLNRTAAGAETYHVRASLAQMLRTGEFFRYSNFGGAGIGYDPTKTVKGIGITDFFAIFEVGVVDLTSATLRLGKTVYSATIAPVQSDIVAAINLVKTVSSPAAELAQLVAVPTNSQVFSVDDLGLVENELTIVMASTGTIQISALGFHVSYNYN